MQLALKGNSTTYHAGYKPNTTGTNRGIGLWTNNYTVGDIDDIAYLWPDKDGKKDSLVINLATLEKQGIKLFINDGEKTTEFKGESNE